MAKARKLNKLDLERFGSKTENRKAREIKIYFLIVSEGGKTEPNYFRKFNGKAGSVIFDVDCEGKGYNTLSLVNEAIRIRDKNPTKYNRVWVVFDKDSFPDTNFNEGNIQVENATF